MVYFIKETFDIEFDYIVQVRPLHKLIDTCNGVFYRPVWTEPVAVFAEFRFTDGLQDLFDTLLYKSVPYTWDSERPCFAIRLRDVFPSNRFGAVAPTFVSVYYLSRLTYDLIG